MSKSKRKAEELLKGLKKGEDLTNLRNRLSNSTEEWHNISSSAYNQSLLVARKKRKSDEQRQHVSVASNNLIESILNLNKELTNYALLLPVIATNSDYELIKQLSTDIPKNEGEILDVIARLTIHPKFRVQQKKGRFEVFDPFKPFTQIIDAATISYFRTNFISCYLTLTPLIEGIILRWMGYKPGDKKPEFEDVRKFFSLSHSRHPNPGNILFHKVFSSACDEILNKHLFKPSTSGAVHDNFNRHVAAHLLNDNEFASRYNCIRLFMLLDTMSELYLYEQRIPDPRFNLNIQNYGDEVDLLANTMLDYSDKSAEHILLGSSINDLL